MYTCMPHWLLNGRNLVSSGSAVDVQWIRMDPHGPVADLRRIRQVEFSPQAQANPLRSPPESATALHIRHYRARIISWRFCVNLFWNAMHLTQKGDL